MKKPPVLGWGSPAPGDRFVLDLTRRLATIVGLTRLSAARSRVRLRTVTSRILIVDDSPRFRAVAAELLVARGFEVLGGVEDGQQALAAVADCCPDGVLVDINLPGEDGFAVAASLAAACPGAKIVLTSGDVDQVPAQVLTTSAAVAFVPKLELALADLRTLLSS